MRYIWWANTVVHVYLVVLRFRVQISAVWSLSSIFLLFLPELSPVPPAFSHISINVHVKLNLNSKSGLGNWWTNVSKWNHLSPRFCNSNKCEKFWRRCTLIVSIWKGANTYRCYVSRLPPSGELCHYNLKLYLGPSLSRVGPQIANVFIH